LAEFTGERVIPGEVDTDLWNEHVARYAFAARLSRTRRVLDAGCGAGYGSAYLALTAARVVGLDRSTDAVEFAASHYRSENLRYVQGSCDSLPIRSGSVDLVVSFEVIEHLKDWAAFLSEARRVLAPGGQAIISTPNVEYYAESRGKTGPNPYHEHEFTFEEFQTELHKVFPHVSMFVQNHSEGFVFQPVRGSSVTEARVESGAGGTENAHFFLAVSALSPQTGAPTFVYLPSTANLLREREKHIELLEGELALKNKWIDGHEAELAERARWAESLNAQLDEARGKIATLQNELKAMSAGYEKKVAEIEAELRKRAEWATETDRQLTVAVDALHKTEKELEERTNWALSLNKQVEDMEAQIRASRWIKIGKVLGIGPPFVKR